MFENKKVIIFDMDGTLIDSVGIWNEVDFELIKQIRTNEEEIIDIQETRDEALKYFSDKDDPYLEYAGFLKNRYGSDLSKEEILELRYNIANDYLINKIDYKPSADKLIKKLNALNYHLIICSTTKNQNMEIYRTLNNNIRSKANLDDYFEKIYTKEDVKEIKPNPEVYIKALEDIKVCKKICLVFEDSLVGVEAAKKAGLEVCAIKDKYSEKDSEKIKELADYYIESFEEVL